jgi:hypothetical protein
MAKTVGDLEEVTRVVLQTAKTPVEMTVDRSKTWKDFSFGFVDPGKWRLPSDLFNATEEYCHQTVRLSFVPMPQALMQSLGHDLQCNTREDQGVWRKGCLSSGCSTSINNRKWIHWHRQ